MAGNLVHLAKAVYAALDASDNLMPTVAALYDELGDFQVAKWIDVGPGGVVIVCLPGYPLAVQQRGAAVRPREYVHIAMRA